MPTDDLLNLLLGCGCKAKCCCGEEDDPALQRPSNLFQSQPRTVRPPPLPEESPFIPSLPSFGTGQRPSNFGQPHLPQNGPDGYPLLEFPQAFPTDATVILDGGQPVVLAGGFVVDHVARVLRPEPQIVDVDVSRTRVGAEFLVVNSRIWERTEIAPPYNAFAEMSLTEDRGGSYLNYNYLVYQHRVISYATGEETSEAAHISRASGSYVVRFEFDRIGAGQSRQLPTAFRLRARRILDELPPGTPPSAGPPPATLYIEGQAQIYSGNLTENGQPEQVWARMFFDWPLGIVDDPENQDDSLTWPFSAQQLRDLPAEVADSGDPTWAISQNISQFVWVNDNSAPPLVEPDPTAVRWTSPDGAVTVTGNPTLNHAVLEGEAVLHTPVGSFAGPGSWGAFRGKSGPVLLVAQADTVTRIDLPTGGAATSQVVPRTDFEAQVLRGQSLVNFARAGPVFNAWPPHEAIVETQTSGGGIS